MTSIDYATAFHPYTITSHGTNSLAVHPPRGQNIIVPVFRLVPLIIFIIGLVLFLTEKDLLFLFLFTGIALLDLVIFSFIKIPGALSMDDVGFTLELLSLKGKTEVYTLWNDVDVIRYRMVRTNNSTALTYEAMLKNGKKISFLTFGNYRSKQTAIPLINDALYQISKKEIIAR